MSPKVPFSRLALGAKLRLLLHPSFFMSSDPVFRSSDQSPPAPIRFGVFEADLRAGELRRNGIKVRLQDLPFRVLTLLLARPGVVITREEFRQAVPLGRLGKPEDMQGIAVFLASDESSYCTGGTYMCDGGLTNI